MIEVDLYTDKLDITLEDEPTYEVEEDYFIELGSDHRKLTHRDAEGQHPIEAIDNLREELEELETDPLSSVEIDEIFKMAVI